MIKLAI